MRPAPLAALAALALTACGSSSGGAPAPVATSSGPVAAPRAGAYFPAESTARSDRFTRAKWAGLLGSRDLQALQPRDFEMLEAGERIPLTLDCVRNP